MLKKILFFFIFIFLMSNFLFPNDISFKITGISGLAFIEKTDINKTLRAFRGSEIHKDYRLRTSSNTQVELTLLKSGNKVGEIIVPQNSILLVNAPINKENNERVSLSLLEGYIKVVVNKNIGYLIEIHTATTSTIVKGAQFAIAFAENGASIVSLNDGNVEVLTDTKSASLSPREAYINTINDESNIIMQSSDSDPIVFLNKGEEESRDNYAASIESLMEAMESIHDDNISISSILIEDENILNKLERKQYRMIAANEGYYNTIIKLINLYPDKRNEMIPYARKSLSLYNANQRVINKITSSVIKSRQKFEKMKKGS